MLKEIVSISLFSQCLFFTAVRVFQRFDSKRNKKLYTVEDEEVEFKSCIKVDLLFTQEQLN
jgi:hypothetical protein